MFRRPAARPSDDAQRGSIHELHGIADIERDAVILANDQVVAILACQALPLTLRDDEETQGLVDALSQVLVSLAYPVQLHIEVGRLDVDRYCEAHAAATIGQTNPALIELGESQRAFVRALARNNHLLERRVVLATALHRSGAAALPSAAQIGALLTRLLPGRTRAADTGGTAPDAVFRDLTARCEDLSHRLAAAGIEATRLRSPALAHLFYRLLQPTLAGRQPLPAQLTDLAIQRPVHSERSGRSGPRGVPGAAVLVATSAEQERLRTGLRRLIDYLAPGSADESADYLRLDDRYFTTLAIKGYPHRLPANWLDRLWRCGIPLRASLSIVPTSAQASV